MKKKKKAQFLKGKSKTLVYENVSVELDFEYSKYTLTLLVNEFKLDENLLKQLISKGTNTTFFDEILITDEIWLSIKEYVIHKIANKQRREKIENSKKIKTGFKGKYKKVKKVKKECKPSPYIIFGNVYKQISTRMGT